MNQFISRLFRLRSLVSKNETKQTEKLQQAEEGGENKGDGEGEEQKPVLENGEAAQGSCLYFARFRTE